MKTGAPLPDGGGGREGSFSYSMASVFVGNIPYDVSEEELSTFMAQVGHVRACRLAGPRAGYAFVDYNDVHVAASAIRNLNGQRLRGRALRVSAPTPADTTTTTAAATTPRDETQAKVDALTPEQCYELMVQMKGLDRESARKILSGSPAFTYALLAVMQRMGMITPDVLLEATAPPPPPPLPVASVEEEVRRTLRSMTPAQLAALPAEQQRLAYQLLGQ